MLIACSPLCHNFCSFHYSAVLCFCAPASCTSFFCKYFPCSFLYFVRTRCCFWLSSLCESYRWTTSSFHTWSDSIFMQMIYKSVRQPPVCLPLFRRTFHLASSALLAWQLADNKGRAELCISFSKSLLCPSLFIPRSSYYQQLQSVVCYLDTFSYEFFCSGFITTVISSIIYNVSSVSFFNAPTFYLDCSSYYFPPSSSAAEKKSHPVFSEVKFLLF